MAFLELEYHFAQLSKQQQILVLVNKVLMFLKFADHDERMRLGVLLEDDDGVSEFNRELE